MTGSHHLLISTVAVAIWNMGDDTLVQAEIQLAVDAVLDGGVSNAIVINNPTWSAEGRSSY